MSLRREVVRLASVEGTNRSELCRRFGISRKTGYKWLRRFEQEGPPGLSDRSRRPHHSPRRTASEVEQRVLALRQRFPGAELDLVDSDAIAVEVVVAGGVGLAAAGAVTALAFGAALEAGALALDGDADAAVTELTLAAGAVARARREALARAEAIGLLR